MDYFACTITDDNQMAEYPWGGLNPAQIRNLEEFRAWPENWVGQVHEDSLIYSGVLWELHEDNIHFTEEFVDNMVFNHLYLFPRYFIEGRDALQNAALSLGCDTPQMWTIQTKFSQHGIGNMLLNDTFEDGVADGWEFSTEGLWHITNYRSANTMYSLAYNQESDHTYDTGSQTEGWAKFDADLSSLGITSANLNFWHYFHVEDYPYYFYDRMMVEISADGGTTWQLLQEWKSTVPSPPPAWQYVSIPLPPSVLGNEISIRFRFDSVDGLYNFYEGWYIDDMEVVIGRL